MKTNIITPPCWNTTASGGNSHRPQLDVTNLHAHFVSCRSSRQPLFVLYCLAETLHGFVTAHVITTLLVVALLMGTFSQAL